MGGSSYDGNVADRQRSTAAWDERPQGDTGQRNSCGETIRTVHPSMDPRVKPQRECRDSKEHPTTTPIALLLDATESRGKDVGVLFERLPRIIGEICEYGIVPHPELSFACYSDAKTRDQAVIQIGEFESDNRLDDELINMWTDGRTGGGTGQESAELLAYFYAHQTELDCLGRGKKGYLFINTDEGIYPTVSKQEVKRWLGIDIKKDIPTKQVFEALQKKFHVFVIYQLKSWEERKKGIDEEIKRRVTEAGGLYDGVDFRASLMWNNRNDLDLHVICPSGEEIWYANKRSRCGGWLDVDMNVHGETTKPVENIRWKTGDAREGRYLVYVQNYRFHEPKAGATEFQVEVEINGEIEHFSGVTPAGSQGHASNQIIGEFHFRREEKRDREKQGDKYAAYADETILSQWKELLSPERVLQLPDPKGIVDIMLGAMILTEGKWPLDQYIAHLKHPVGQTEKRCAEIKAALSPLAEKLNMPRVAVGDLQSKRPTKKPPKSRRI